MTPANIYKITCLETNKIYIGQTKHSIRERWLHHLRMSKYKSELHPITREIDKLGKDNFKIELVETCEYEQRFKRENYWIDTYQSLYPKGYNKIKNTEYRDIKPLLEDHLVEAEMIEIIPIKNSGVYNRIYVQFTFDLDKFGIDNEENLYNIRYDYKNDQENFKDFMYKIIQQTQEKYSGIIPIKLNQKLNFESDVLCNYRDKINEVMKIKIEKIKISTVKSNELVLCVIYITNRDNPGWKNQKKMCFGGKNVPIKDAIQIGKKFCQELLNLCDYPFEIEETNQCQQQEATIEAVV